MQVRVYLGAFLMLAGLCLAIRAAAITHVTVPLLLPLGVSLALGAATGTLLRQRRVIVRQRLALEQRRRPAATPARRYRPAAKHGDRRVGDAERTLVTTELHDCFAGGYLDRAELDERLDQTLAAKTVAELVQVLHDLPIDLPAGGANV